MLDRQHLAIVREVERTGSFTAAAERLNVSQSALSHAVAKFEERHGARIWDRTGRSLRLTRAGEHLARLAARFLPELEHAERLIGQLARGHRGTLRIGMECHPCEKWLMRVTAPFLKAWPDVDLDVRNTFRADGADALRVYEIDMLATPDPVSDPLLTFEPVCDYDLSLIVPQDHALAGKKSICPSDLAGETLLTLPVPVERLDIFMRFLLPADIKPGRRIEIETTELMLQMAAAGRGLTVLPDWIARDAQATLPVRAVRIGSGLRKSINLGYRTADRHTDFITAFVEMARSMPRA